MLGSFTLPKKIITKIFNGKLSKLDKLYNSHKGEECYIFGDGASIKWMDLEHFTDRVSIIGNMCIHHKQINALRVPYCATVEPFYFYPIVPIMFNEKRCFFNNKMGKKYREAIASKPETLFLLNYSNYFATNRSNIIFVSRHYIPKFEYNNPFKDRLDSHQGTFKFQISLAIFMGFKKAYLIGHDYTHLPSRNGHFYEKGKGTLVEQKDFCKDFILYAKKYIEIITITLREKSENLQYVTYKDFTGADLDYKENTEVVSMDKLKSFAVYPGYSIF